MRSLTVSLLTALILSMGLFGLATTLVVADQPAVSQPGLELDGPIPLYNPPKKLTPRARVGGGLRGADGDDPVLEALVPDHVGLTFKKTPILNWFLSKPTTYPLKFTISDIGATKPLHEGLIPTPVLAGIQSLDLNDWNITLEPDVQYRWYVSAIRDSEAPSKDIVVGGMIERCEFNECLVLRPILTCDRQSVPWNAKSGFWYDAMACLCELINVNPSDQSLRRDRAALLNQIGLSGVAQWDLQSIQTPAR